MRAGLRVFVVVPIDHCRSIGTGLLRPGLRLRFCLVQRSIVHLLATQVDLTFTGGAQCVHGLNTRDKLGKVLQSCSSRAGGP